MIQIKIITGATLTSVENKVNGEIVKKNLDVLKVKIKSSNDPYTKYYAIITYKVGE